MLPRELKQRKELLLKQKYREFPGTVSVSRSISDNNGCIPGLYWGCTETRDQGIKINSVNDPF